MSPQPVSQSSPQSPSPPQSPSGPEGERSAASSTAFSGAPDFVADAGPAFDPKTAPEAPLFEDELDQQPEGWLEDTVRELLVTQGEVTHWMLRVGDETHDPDSWEHTQKDLGRIAPPLTRMLNRYDITRAAAAAGDEASLAAALSVYVARNYTKRRRLLAELRELDQPQPLTGVPADADLGPDHDAEYQRVHEAPPQLVPKGRRR